jgi:CheY-like chemotaxis protein
MATVLVVDDDDDIRRVLRRLLEHHGYRVLDAALAEDALALVAGDDPPDVIITDVVMPGMDGLAFYRELAARSRELARRVVFLTGVHDVPEIHQAIEQMGAPLLGKLDDLQLVLDAVRLTLLKAPH